MHAIVEGTKMVLNSEVSNIHFPEKLFGTYIHDEIVKFGDSVALLDPQSGAELTFQELKEQALNFAERLLTFEIKKGDVVALVVPFQPKFIALTIGVALTKATVAFYNIDGKLPEILTILRSSEPTICIVDHRRANFTIDELKKNLKSLNTIFSVDEIERVNPDGTQLSNDQSLRDTDVYNDPLCMFYTSGTTGEPKAVVVANHAMVALAECGKRAFPLERGDAAITLCTRLHAFSIGVTLIYLALGVKHVVVSSLSPENFTNYVSKYCVKGIMMADPFSLSKIVDEVEKPSPSLQFLLGTGTTYPPILIEKARKKFGITVGSIWGSTETSLITISTSNSSPAESVGRLLPTVSLKVLDIVSGQEVSANAKGELCVKSPFSFKGYSAQADHQALAKNSEEWFRTGDIGVYDENGFVYVVGRIKDIIKCDGSPVVYPVELEGVLMSHPGVADVAVTRVEHPLYVEAPKAFIVKRDPNLTKEELLEYFNEKVSKHKMLHGGIEFIDTIPRNSVGKPLKRFLV